MTVPPFPASPCVRVALDYLATDSTEAGSRFYLSYSGAAPSAGNCVTLAGDIATAWNTDLASLVSSEFSLVNVDVQDLATETGAHGAATVSHPGTMSGEGEPSQVATNVEFNISRRYRGGKPRMYLPAPSNSAQLDQAHWTDDFVGDVNTGMAAFFTAIGALSVGSMGDLAHVSLSYYNMFKNVTNSSGRTRAAPTYRDTALVDPVTGYSCKGLMGSQRRRRAATSY